MVRKWVYIKGVSVIFVLVPLLRRPTNLYVVWTRRSRRVVSTPLTWEPDLVDPLSANMVWQVPDNHTITVTLFRDPRTRELEDKDWTFAIEDVSYLFCFLIIHISLWLQAFPKQTKILIRRRFSCTFLTFCRCQQWAKNEFLHHIQ